MTLELRKYKSLSHDFQNYMNGFLHDYKVNAIVDMIGNITIITIISFKYNPINEILDNKIFLEHLNKNNFDYIRFIPREYFKNPTKEYGYFAIKIDKFYAIGEILSFTDLKNYIRKEKIKDILQ